MNEPIEETKEVQVTVPSRVIIHLGAGPRGEIIVTNIEGICESFLIAASIIQQAAAFISEVFIREAQKGHLDKNLIKKRNLIVQPENNIKIPKIIPSSDTRNLH